MRHLTILATSFTLAVLGTAASAADDKPDTDKVMKAMQGTWTFESHLMGGQALLPEKRKAMTITFTDDKFSIKDGDAVVQAGTVKIDVSGKVYAVDTTATEGEGKGATMPGIFAIDGDAMRTCFDTAGKARPEKFASPDKSTLALVVLKRVKK